MKVAMIVAYVCLCLFLGEVPQFASWDKGPPNVFLKIEHVYVYHNLGQTLHIATVLAHCHTVYILLFHFCGGSLQHAS